MLSLVHLYAVSVVTRRRKGWTLSFYLKGDDLISVWARCIIEAYNRQILPLTGMPPNPGKAHRAPDRGLFCEKPLSLQVHPCTPDPYALVQDNHSVSLRALVTSTSTWPGSTPALKGLPSLSVPANVGAIQYLRKEIPRIGHHRAWVLQNLVSGPLRQRAREAKLLTWLPLELGGLGLIPRDPDYKFDDRVAGALWGFHNGIPEALRFFRTRFIEALPKDSLEAKAADAMKAVRSVMIWRMDHVPSRDVEDWIEAERLRISLTALAEGSKPAGPMTYSSFHSFIKEGNKNLASLHPMKSPMPISWRAVERWSARLGVDFKPYFGVDGISSNKELSSQDKRYLLRLSQSPGTGYSRARF
jgi:hypothetical protein